VHTLRARVDAVLTGIGTVRTDDPLLTARGVRRIRRPALRVVLDSALQIDPASALVRTARLSPPDGAPAVVLCQPGADPARRTALESLGVRVHEVPGGPGGIDLRAALRTLAEREGVATCMLECGPTLLGAFADAGLIDAAVVYIAPTLLADDRALPSASGRDAPRLSDAQRFTLARVRRCGEDVELTYLAAAPVAAPAARG
jgi:riboflavin-specific deaminase-like protein